MPKWIPNSKNKKTLIRQNKSILSYFARANESLNDNSDSSRSETLPSSLNLSTSKDRTLVSRGKINPYAKKHPLKCPSYKWLTGTPFTVDAFKYGEIDGCSGYFLTHFHCDHYGGISSKFKGTVYCSEVTARLVRLKFGKLISLKALPTNTFVCVDGYDILFVDANHCPGAIMIISCLPGGYVNLHTGDFRAHTSMLHSPSALAMFVQNNLSNRRVNTIFLDTTFCAPQYAFPEQDLVISAAVEISREALLNHPLALILCGMYTIGKERFVVGLAEQLGMRIWLPSNRIQTVAAAAEGGCEFSRRLLLLATETPAEARLHVVEMTKLNPRSVLANYLPLGKPFIIWKPSGWMYNPQKKITDATLRRLPCNPETFLRLRSCVSVEMLAKMVYVFGAAYSEHSSFYELKEFITMLKPDKVQPTVFGETAKNARKHIDRWLQSDEKVQPVAFSGTAQSARTYMEQWLRGDEKSDSLSNRP